MMRLASLAPALVLVSFFAGAPPARADEGAPDPEAPEAAKKAEARRHFEQGTLRFDEGRYQEAIEHFEAAFEITGAPEILYNIGRCHEELGHGRTAATYYERYLEQQPDAADAAEARERMERLRPAGEGEADTKEENGEGKEEGKSKTEEASEALGGTLLGVTIGAAAPVTGEWDRVMVPFALVLHFPLLDWLYVSGAVAYGGFAGDEPKAITGYPTNAVDVAVGLTGFKTLNGLFSLMGTLGVGSVFLVRDRHETAIWLDPRLALGLAIHFFGAWSATVEATGSFGPVFVPRRTNFDPWSDPASPTADVGGRLGIFYAF